MREELAPLGVEIVTVSLEMSGPEASAPFIEAAGASHPSLLDPKHQLDALFGVVNIPNVFWIDEDGVIVRPPEPGWAGADSYPGWLRTALADRDAKIEKIATELEATDPERAALMRGGQDRFDYLEAMRDWAANGAESRFAMTPSEVVAASTPRDGDESRGAAHFELANHLWSEGNREAAFDHFRQAHRLQPDNWTYKRQAWSVVGNENAGGGELGRFNQGPTPGSEDDWPFDSDFNSETSKTPAGRYYPKTL